MRVIMVVTEEGGVEAEQLEMMMTVLDTVHFEPQVDSWIWGLDSSGSFFVRSVRNHVDVGCLSSSDSITSRNQFVLIEVNIFLWRLSMNHYEK